MSVTSSLDLDSDPRAIKGMRIIAAPRDLVWNAFTDPKHLAEWWGPNGFTTTTTRFEFREGGVWRFVMHGPNGRDYENRIIFDEIVKPERLAWRHDGGEAEVEPVVFEQTVTFEDIDGKTRITWQGVFPTAEHRDRVVREYGAAEGLVQNLARLDRYVTKTGHAAE